MQYVRSFTFTCLDETSYSSSHPLRAFSKDVIILYLFLSSDNGISLHARKSMQWVHNKPVNQESWLDEKVTLQPPQQQDELS